MGGYELGCRQVVEALTDAGHDLLVLTSPTARPTAAQPRVRRNFVFRQGLPLPYGGPTPTDQAIALRHAEGGVVNAHNVAVLVATIEEFRPEVIYLWNLGGIGGLGIAGAIAYLQLPTVWHLMDAVPNQAASLSQGSTTATASLLCALSQRLRSVYIACSRRLAREISIAGFDFGGNLRIVPNWATPPTEEVDRQYFTPGGGLLRVVSAGQLAPHKGVQHIIEAARLLIRDGRVGFHVEIFGPGLEDQFASLIMRRGVQRFVTLKGSLPQNELVDRYWNRDVFVMPTWTREPFGFASLEAARRGCVPIVSRDCGYAEWFVDGLHCLKVAPTAQSIGHALSNILDGKIALESIARRAMDVARDDFSIDNALPQIEKAFDDASQIPIRRAGSYDDSLRLAHLAEALLRDHVESAQ
jgi:glycosyltransferase involved in cell wall biosynthesis